MSGASHPPRSRARHYTSLAQLEADGFATDSPEYQYAQQVFASPIAQQAQHNVLVISPAPTVE